MRRTRRIRNLTVEEFEAMFGPDWTGWSFGNGMLNCPSWRVGFTAEQLRALFFCCQQVAGLEAKIRLLERDLGRLDEENKMLTKQSAFYRRQLLLEARLGLALCRMDQQ